MRGSARARSGVARERGHHRVDDVITTEGDAGQTAFRFSVSLDRSLSTPVKVSFATGDGTATAVSDYVATSGTVTFAPGDTSEQVTVQVNGDHTVEPDEVFKVNFADVTGNATIADGQAMATIVNDDQPATAQPPAGPPATDRPPPSVPVDVPGRERGSQRFALDKVRLNTKTGTATIAVTVPGPGRLAISAGGGKAGRVPTRRVKAAGTVQLLVKASGKQRRTLVRTGRATVKVTITYTPLRGRPSTRSRSVRLRTAH